MTAAVIVSGVVVVALLALVGVLSTRRRAAEERARALEEQVGALEAERDALTARAEVAEGEAETTRTELAATTVRATRAEQEATAAATRADTAERQGTELEARLAEREQALTEAAERLGAVEAELADATGRTEALEAEVAAAGERVVALEADLVEVTGRETALAEELAAGRARVDELDAEVAERRDEVARLEAELAAAARFDADGWWRLETRRADRLWHDRVALPGWPDPMVPDGVSRDEHLREAVRVFTETSREESGVVIDLTWDVGRDLPPDLCVAVLRLAEELVAVARASDGGELSVVRHETTTGPTAAGTDTAGARGAGVLEVRLATEPSVPAPADLAESIARFGWSAADDHGTITITIPLPA